MSSLLQWMESRVSAENHPDNESALPEAPVEPAQPVTNFQPLEVDTFPSTSTDGIDTLQQLRLEEAMARDTEVLEDAVVTVEAYIHLLRNAGPQGIDRQTAQSMVIGLAPYRQLLERVSVPSVECFSTPHSAQYATMISQEGLGARLLELWKTLKDLFYRMLDQGADFYRQFQQGVGRLREQAVALKRPLAALRGTPTITSFTLHNPSKLMADGKYQGDDPTVIAGVAGWFFKQYPLELAEYMRALARGVDLITPENLEQMADKLLEIEGPHQQFHLANKDTLPGNVTIVAESTEGVGEDKLRGLSLLLSAQRFVLKPVPGAQVDTLEITVRSPQELSKGLTDLLKTIDLIDEMRSKAPALVEVSKALLNSTDKLRIKMDTVALTGEQLALVQAIMRGTFAVTRMSGPDLHPLIMYLVSVVQAQLAVLEREIRSYKTA